ncbi:hypothetical protein DLD99_14385 [Pseudomonas kribbensis]|uniref:Transcriptional regulator n=1 Tax=Pseudomonas kribbensis TaxID=1628086 RepID=A0A345RQP5_9PSED|nr:hypothetical protein [Pseudomonas kribbensis]AXI61611.1 hypothetical protein DLD99_14385 [Pseudomonas kribbensis]
MASEHIERFDTVATNVLKALHSKFPAAFHPTPNSIGLTDEEPVTVNGRREFSEEYDRLSTETKQALNFLIEEGFVHDRQYRIGPSHVITAKGLKALERIDPAFPAPALADM